MIIALALGGAQAFQASAPAKAGTKLHAYVPSGMSKAEYDALKKKVRTRCEKIRAELSKNYVCTRAGSRRQKKEELRRGRRARFRK